jgi:hypothetical protein
VNNELGKVWKDTGVVSFEVLFQRLPVETEENMNILSHGVQFQNRHVISGFHIRSRNATLSTEIFNILPRPYIKSNSVT